MEQVRRFTLDEAQKEFATQINGEVWDYLGKERRSEDELERMVLAAYASLYHSLHAGAEVHRQRGEWLVSHVHSVLGESAPALAHAQRCHQLTEDHRAQIEDFDVAYAYEALARAFAVSGDLDSARKYRLLAQAAGETIADRESKSIFQNDLSGGNWRGVQ